MPNIPTTPSHPKTGGRQRGTPNKPTAAKRPKTGGRRKGTPNKSTAAIREAMLQVFADLQARAGGENGHLLEWASGNATDFYKLTARMLPNQITGDDGGPVITRIELVAATPEEIAREREEFARERGE
jgi:hypothetical protein